jgi:hypothetical protein
MRRVAGMAVLDESGATPRASAVRTDVSSVIGRASTPAGDRDHDAAMRWGVLGLVIGLATPAFADDAFEACKARRTAMAIEVERTTDADAKTRLIMAMPRCWRDEAGRSGVTEPVPPDEDTSPFVPHHELAMRAGAAAISGFRLGEGSGIGPYVEVEVANRWARAISVAAHVGVMRLHDPNVYNARGDMPENLRTVHDTMIDVGLRLHGHFRRFTYGAGVGLAIEHTDIVMGAEMPRTGAQTLFLGAVGVDAAYVLLATRGIAAQLSLGFELAGSSHEIRYGDVKLAVGLRL